MNRFPILSQLFLHPAYVIPYMIEMQFYQRLYFTKEQPNNTSIEQNTYLTFSSTKQKFNLFFIPKILQDIFYIIFTYISWCSKNYCKHKRKEKAAAKPDNMGFGMIKFILCIFNLDFPIFGLS